MASIELIKGSDGTGNASVATVQSTRSSGASTIVVDTVANINPTGFAGSMGTPHTFTDPITSETITVISEATCVDFTGHVDGSNLEIDDIAPGYTDLGSEIGDIIIIRPTTQYADNIASTLDVSHNDDGSIHATRPQVVTSIDDTNGNELLKVTPTASAVNELTLANAATGNGPTVSATGGDTNIDINFAPKGTGLLKGIVNKLYNPYKFRYTASAVAVATSAALVKFATSVFDTGSNYSASTGLFTAPIAGYYAFYLTGQFGISNSGNNYALAQLVKNGSTAYGLSSSTAPGFTGSTQGVNIYIVLQLAANDTIEVQLWNTYGTTYTGSFGGHLLSAG